MSSSSSSARDYARGLHLRIEHGKKSGELSAFLDSDAAATLFIGMIQRLVMQSLLKGNVQKIRLDAPRIFEIYRRGIENTP